MRICYVPSVAQAGECSVFLQLHNQWSVFRLRIPRRRPFWKKAAKAFRRDETVTTRISSRNPEKNDFL